MMNRSLKYRKLLAVFLGICPILNYQVAQAASLIKSETDILNHNIESTSQTTDSYIEPQSSSGNFFQGNLDSEIESIYLGNELNPETDILLYIDSLKIDPSLYKALLDSYQLLPSQNVVSGAELFNSVVGSLSQLNFNLEAATNTDASSSVIFLPIATAQNLFQGIYDNDITLGEYRPELYRRSPVANNNITDPSRFEISLFQLPIQPRSLNNRVTNNDSNRRFTPDNIAGYFNNNLIARYNAPSGYNPVSVVSSARTEPISLSSSLGSIRGNYNPVSFANQILKEKKDQLESLGQGIAITNPAKEIIKKYKESNRNSYSQIGSYDSVITQTSNISEKDRRELEKQLRQEQQERKKMQAQIRRNREREQRQQEREAKKQAREREKSRKRALKMQTRRQKQLNRSLQKSIQNQRRQSEARASY